jgi:hypothetical protein
MVPLIDVVPVEQGKRGTDRLPDSLVHRLYSMYSVMKPMHYFLLQFSFLLVL